ncbi:hypothetical protein [Streptomyces sp. NPDC001100]
MCKEAVTAEMGVIACSGRANVLLPEVTFPETSLEAELLIAPRA